MCKRLWNALILHIQISYRLCGSIDVVFAVVVIHGFYLIWIYQLCEANAGKKVTDGVIIATWQFQMHSNCFGERVKERRAKAEKTVAAPAPTTAMLHRLIEFNTVRFRHGNENELWLLKSFDSSCPLVLHAPTNTTYIPMHFTRNWASRNKNNNNCIAKTTHGMEQSDKKRVLFHIGAERVQWHFHVFHVGSVSFGIHYS